MRRVAIALVLMAAAPAAANPIDAFGLGARGAAMGGAQTAGVSDSAANYYNPARLAALEDIHIDIGYRAAVPRLAINDLDLGVDTSRGLHAGLAVPGRLAGLPVALGGAIFLPDQHASRVRALPRSQPRFALFDNRPQRLFLAANLAVAITDRLRVGGGIAYMSNTEGGVTLAGRLGFPNAADSELDLAIDVDLVTIRYPQAGIAYDVSEWLSLGASYRGQFNLVSDLRIRVEGDIGGAGSPIVEDGFLDLRSISQDLFQPAQITAGAAIEAGGGWRVAFDATFARWSRFEHPAADIEIEVDIGEFNDLVDLPEPLALPAPRFHDILIPRLGLEGPLGRLGDGLLAGRAGYSWEPSPAPEQVGETNFVDNDKHTLSIGIGWVLDGLGEIVPKPVSIDGYLGLTWLPGREHRKLSPVDPVGDYRSSGVVAQGGITSRWRF
jgi:long-chain fatty acid transport protein